MTSISPLPPAAVSTRPPAPAPASAASASTARAADGDYKTKGVGHEVKDADGDYKPTSPTTSAVATTASSTLAALLPMKLGG